MAMAEEGRPPLEVRQSAPDKFDVINIDPRLRTLRELQTTDPLPKRTFNIGRGARGQVLVVFPTQNEADLYAFVGRNRREIRGDPTPLPAR